jgi:predicted nucleotidyltransferase
MDRSLLNSIDKILEDKSIEALYIYGSYVNGYYRKNSDIDIVALTSTNFCSKHTSMPPNISIHLIHPLDLQFYKSGFMFTYLKMLPVHNKEKCIEISNKMKSELVRRELVRFRKNGIEEFDVLDPINNFLLGYASLRPWRMRQIKRIFESDEAQGILKEEYGKILGILEQKSMVEKRNGKFALNPSYVFDEEIKKLRDGFLYKLKNSYCGWHYLRNAFSMIDFSRRRK